MGSINPNQFNILQFLVQSQKLLQDAASLDETLPTALQGNPLRGLEEGQLSQAELFQQSSLLSTQEMGTLAKEILKMPSDMKELLLGLSLLEDSEASGKLKKAMTQNLKTLLDENIVPSTLSSAQADALLSKKVNEGLERLNKLLNQNMMAQTKGSSQVAETLNHLRTMADSLQTMPNQGLKNLILLALPWYPLIQQQKLDWEASGGGDTSEEAGGGATEKSITLLLQTNSLGRFRIQLSEGKALQVSVMIQFQELAKLFVPQLEVLFDTYLAGEGLARALWNGEMFQEGHDASKSTFSDLIQASSSSSLASFKGFTRQENRQSVDIQRGDLVSLLLVQCGFTMAKLVFEADNQQKYLQRKA
jgi:hypothetical protein